MKADPKKRYTMAEVRSHPWFTQARGGVHNSDAMNTRSEIGNDSDGDLRNNRSNDGSINDDDTNSSGNSGIEDSSKGSSSDGHSSS